MEFKTITIIGEGRFGSYLRDQIAQADSNIELFCFDTLSQIIPNFDFSFRKQVLGKTQLLIFCVPIRDFEQAIANYRDIIPDYCVVMDTCSVKSIPCQILGRLQKQRPNIHIIGSHPLFGPQSAPISCRGQRVALVDISGGQTSIFVSNFWQTLLGTTVIQTTAEEHDRQMGTQLLNHFIGRAATSAGITRVPLSTKTHELFMDIVDIISGNSIDLFEDMNTFNPYSTEIREKFLESAMSLHNRLTLKENPSIIA